MPEIRGLDQLGEAVRRLDFAANRIPRELRPGLQRAAAELVDDAQRNAKATLPQRGGYADIVAGQTEFTVGFERSSSGVQLVIRAIGPDRRLDTQGRLRHPVYARGPSDDWNWAKETQHVKPGWFTGPMKAGRALVRTEVLNATRRAFRRR